ncbi:ribulose-5-phosphate 4-epimerase/fuculose-1-phosphate aldolase [Chiayiivirga flava]|uniref:Ribulose-5-phosphate 4-epimerase/fuculose-1-phosphate aldolase n=2 Tax=Chiayiivirga flava TaxID=659595 RepID=A0A7W8D7I8_9GAMM|nr:ribulose-5-phosphate 4-epimerase/fuculose-1-phosphate aldolase [Chiayiivirga flava]
MSTMIRPDVRDRVSPEEWQLRVDLAACYRLIALHGWSDLVFTHISAKLPGDDERFLINPYGALFEEITASSLVTVNLAGEKVDDSPFPINPAGFTIHSAIHAARHDVGCVLHVHTVNGIAVSAQKNGLMPISQQSIFVLSSLGYHGYEGVALRDDEKPRLVQHLGGNTFLMLRNHGLLTVGAGIPDAFLAMYLFETCCAIQIRAQSGGGELVQVHPQIVATAQQQAAQVTKNLGGQLVWPGLLRKLDRIDASFRE